jgi:site-specific DNA-adenine methylase
MLTNLFKSPFPYWGGKSDAAETVWGALGDVSHYVEPFAGSLAALLRRPHPANRAHFTETVNDLDGLLVNAWRAIAQAPDEVAKHAAWPVSEADLMARHLSLVAWRNEKTLERLMADPDYFDAKMAGWWVWGTSCWIGSGWCTGNGPWVVGDDGRITKAKDGSGVSRQIPHVSTSGQGINHPGVREGGVALKIPSVTDDGRGINHPGTREVGVSRQLPSITDSGRGINHPGTREEGVGDEGEFHPMTMPETLRWMRFLSARLRHVRILNGSWERVCTSGVLKVLSVRQGKGLAGVFLDPPYDNNERTSGLYAHDSGHVATDAREWCKANGDDPMYRIVLAGYDTEHTELESLGWRVVEWFKPGFLKGGMGNQSDKGSSQRRERLWISPHCVNPTIAPTSVSLDDLLGF